MLTAQLRRLYVGKKITVNWFTPSGKPALLRHDAGDVSGWPEVSLASNPVAHICFWVAGWGEAPHLFEGLSLVPGAT